MKPLAFPFASLIVVLSIFSLVHADSILNNVLETLGLQSFPSAIMTDSFPQLPSGICASSTFSGWDENSNEEIGASFTATVYMQLLTSNIIEGIVSEYTYQLYWYFNYETDIAATGFNFYNSKFQNGELYYNLDGSFYLTYQSTLDTLITPTCTTFNYDNWVFEFENTEGSSRLLLFAGGSTVFDSYSNSAYSFARNTVAQILSFGYPNYSYLMSVYNGVCLLSYIDTCVAPPIPTSTTTTRLSVEEECTIEEVDVLIGTVITSTIITTTETYVSTSTSWVGGSAVSEIPLTLTTSYTATVPAWISTTITSAIATTTECVVSSSSSSNSYVSDPAALSLTTTTIVLSANDQCTVEEVQILIESVISQTVLTVYDLIDITTFTNVDGTLVATVIAATVTDLVAIPTSIVVTSTATLRTTTMCFESSSTLSQIVPVSSTLSDISSSVTSSASASASESSSVFAESTPSTLSSEALSSEISATSVSSGVLTSIASHSTPITSSLANSFSGGESLHYPSSNLSTTLMSRSSSQYSGGSLLSTETDESTTVITITSCIDNKCSKVPQTTGVIIIATTVSGVITSYTTYCPLTGTQSSATVVEYVTVTASTTTVVEITSCSDNKCNATTITTGATIVTATVNGIESIYTTYCPLIAILPLTISEVTGEVTETTSTSGGNLFTIKTESVVSKVPVTTSTLFQTAKTPESSVYATSVTPSILIGSAGELKAGTGIAGSLIIAILSFLY